MLACRLNIIKCPKSNVTSPLKSLLCPERWYIFANLHSKGDLYTPYLSWRDMNNFGLLPAGLHTTPTWAGFISNTTENNCEAVSVGPLICNNAYYSQVHNFVYSETQVKYKYPKIALWIPPLSKTLTKRRGSMQFWRKNLNPQKETIIIQFNRSSEGTAEVFIETADSKVHPEYSTDLQASQACHFTLLGKRMTFCWVVELDCMGMTWYIQAKASQADTIWKDQIAGNK